MEPAPRGLVGTGQSRSRRLEAPILNLNATTPPAFAAVRQTALDGVSLATIASAARHWAHTLWRLGRSTLTSRDDLFQDLVLALLRRWPDYDASRSAPATFADRVARSAALNRLEAARAAKRGRHVVPVPWAAVAERHGSHTDPVLRLDVHRQLATLDPASRQVCEALVLYPVAEAARVLGLSRGALRRRITKLRTTFEDAGLRAHLEAA